MRTPTKILAGLLVVAAGGWFAGCNSTIDDGSGPAVVLEVENVVIPPIATTQDTNGNCTFTLTAANATFKNKPKNSGADVSPFNDIILKGVDVVYYWDDGTLTPDRTLGLGGSVPAGGSSTGQFIPVSNTDLTTYDRSGKSATLQMTFRGQTVSGDDVSVTTGGTLQVNSCVQPNVGACCQGINCSQQTLQNCANAGGTYQGDFTTCLTVVCQ